LNVTEISRHKHIISDLQIKSNTGIIEIRVTLMSPLKYPNIIYWIINTIREDNNLSEDSRPTSNLIDSNQ